MVEALVDYEMWSSFIEAKYLAEAPFEGANCPGCNIGKDCNNHFCLKCKVGGLCLSLFKPEQYHHGHPRLQVRRNNRSNAVVAKDLENFIGTSFAGHIYKCTQNNKALCYLKSRKEDASPRQVGAQSKLRECDVCKYVIPKPMNEDSFVVCSLQCLVAVAQQQPDLNLLEIKDGAMNPEHGPKTAHEKLGGTSTELVQVGMPRRATVSPERRTRSRVAREAVLPAQASETSDGVDYSEFEIGHGHTLELDFLVAAYMQ